MHIPGDVKLTPISTVALVLFSGIVAWAGSSIIASSQSVAAINARIEQGHGSRDREFGNLSDRVSAHDRQIFDLALRLSDLEKEKK